MTSAVSTLQPSFRGVPWAWALGLILVAGTIWHGTAYENTDIAWLVTAGEHLLDGAVPYVDVVETNPPGSILLYLPSVLIGRALGIDPYGVVVVLTTLAVAASLAACTKVLGGLPSPFRRSGSAMIIAVAVVLELVPAGNFAQREHLILLGLLPLLCSLAVRQAEPRPWVPLELRATVAAAAGIGIAIKPQYALGLIGPAVLVWRRTGWRGLAGTWELWLAGALAALLGLAQLAAFPAFTQSILPLLARVYLPSRQSLAALVALPGGSLGGAALLVYGLVRRVGAAIEEPRLADTGALASAGFFAAYVMQGKGWSYHDYPAVATALIAIAAVLLPAAATVSAGTIRAKMRLLISGAGSVVLAGGALMVFDTHLDIDAVAPGLAPAIEALGPHPTIMSLASDIAIGHPLVRRVGGRWVGTLVSGWIGFNVSRIDPGAGRAGPLGPDLAYEDRIMASDIRDRRPDAVLASTTGWSDWIGTEPLVREALAGYRVAGTFGSVMLWTRRSGL